MFCYKSVLVVRRIYFFPKRNRNLPKSELLIFSGPRFFKSVFWGKLKRLILSPVSGVILPRVVLLYHFRISSPVCPLKMRRGAPRSFISIVRLQSHQPFRLYNAHETLRPLSIYSYRPRYDVLKFCPWMLTTIVSNTLRVHPLILSPFLAPKITWDMQTYHWG